MKQLHSFLFAVLIALPAQAAHDLMVMDPWSPEAPPVAPVLAGYMMLHNNGKTDQRIVAAESPAFKKVEFHRSEMNNNQMRMVKQKDLLVAAGQMVSLEPGGLHLMLFDPRQVFKKGDQIPVTLILQNDNRLQLALTVRAASTEEHHHHH